MNLSDLVQKTNHEKAILFVDAIRTKAHEAWDLRVGAIVEVIKRGETPKGIYTVTRGPYRASRGRARLVDVKHEVAKVEFFRVPRGSCKMHPNFDLAIPYIWDGEYRDDVRNLIVNVLKSGCTEFSWKLVAEFVEEREIHPKTLPGYGLLDEQKEMLTPGWFAEALRCIVSADHPLFYPSAIVAITKPYYVR